MDSKQRRLFKRMAHRIVASIEPLTKCCHCLKGRGLLTSFGTDLLGRKVKCRAWFECQNCHQEYQTFTQGTDKLNRHDLKFLKHIRSIIE